MSKTKSLTIGDLLKMFLQHVKLIIALSLLGTLLAFLYVTYMVTPVYSTSSLVLVQNGSFDGRTTSTSSLNGDKVNPNDITSSVMLANTCATLFTVDPEMRSIISGSSVSIAAVEDAYFLRITSSSSDPNTAANIANRVAEAAPAIYKKYFGDAGEVKKVDDASVPSAPSSPSKRRYIIIGFLGGLIISLVISFLLEIIDTTIKPGDDLYKQYEIPVFAEIVDFEVEGGAKKK